MPHLFAIEGADRTGKATQARLLRDALRARKIRATVETIPFADRVTHPEIYRMLRDGAVRRYPSVFQTLQATNRRFFQVQILPTLLRHHDVIILDRWVLSTRVYGSASGVADHETEEVLQGLVEADTTVVLDSPAWPRDNLDILESDSSFQERVRTLYRDACQPPVITKIDASRSRALVHQDILDLAIERIANPSMVRARQ